MRNLKMTNKKLLFIWNYHYFPFEKGKSRFSDLLEAFVKEGYQVEVVTSSFYHMFLRFRRSIYGATLYMPPARLS